MRKYIVAIGLCVSLSVGAEPAGKPPAIRAMQEELGRQMKDLSLPNLPRPYYLEYALSDNRKLLVVASLGALQDSIKTRDGFLRVGVRVGDEKFDQTGYSGFGGLNFFSLPYEFDYDVMKHELWLATDEAYKAALEAYAQKKAFEATRVKKSEVSNFTKAPAAQWQNPLKDVALDASKWEPVAREVSAVFKKYPEITDSWVHISISAEDRYFVNSEGSEGYQTNTLARLVISAQTRADDGMPLQLQAPFVAITADELPSKAELEKRATELAEQLKALRNAKPFDEDYIGPILFEGVAATQIIRTIFAERFSSTPPPQNESATEEEGGRGNFSTKIGKKVAPKFLSFEDDPTLKEYNKIPLIGSYKLDEEGIPASKLMLVEKGILKTLLSSRTPSKQIKESNGRGRGSMTIDPKGRISNMIVRADKGLSAKDLRKKAIEAAKGAGLPYVIVVQSLAMFDFIPEYTFAPMSSFTSEVPPALIAYKVYPDGKEELIRGLALSEIDLRSFQHLIAAGSDANVLSFLSNGFANFMNASYALDYSSFQIPMSIVAPSILFDEAEAKKVSGAPETPPLMTHPIFNKKTP
jgi:TldD protein